MDTKLWKVPILTEGKSHDAAALTNVEQAAAQLVAGEVVAFPTETVYGLGGNALSSSAVSKIFAAKGRPSDNPLIVHVASLTQLTGLVAEIPLLAQTLFDTFSPGPLTVLLPLVKDAENKLSPLVTCGLDCVGIRIPDHPTALAVLRAANVPIAAPSANTSSRPSPTSAEHVLLDLQGKICGVVDSGATGVGVESTVVDCLGVNEAGDSVVTILRPGGITQEALVKLLGPERVLIDPGITNESVQPRAPGLKYKHYAPSAPVFLVEGDSKSLQQVCMASLVEGKRVGVLVPKEDAAWYADKQNVTVHICGTRADLPSVAQNLYGCLRDFDSTNVDLILSTTFPAEGIGRAIMNRLDKAAGNNRKTP
jgi:L-threonylcarbamoyladenylate synthase